MCGCKGTGIVPQKPSVLAATAYMCPSQEGLSDSEKVMSLMANFLARRAKFGSSLGLYPETQT